jgi:hypothetical protein
MLEVFDLLALHFLGRVVAVLVQVLCRCAQRHTAQQKTCQQAKGSRWSVTGHRCTGYYAATARRVKDCFAWLLRVVISVVSHAVSLLFHKTMILRELLPEAKAFQYK